MTMTRGDYDTLKELIMNDEETGYPTKRVIMSRVGKYLSIMDANFNESKWFDDTFTEDTPKSS